METVLPGDDNTPLVSVIVPVYNVEQYLERCIESILSQTYQNMEIILVDDGSTDNSGRICERYQGIDKRIRVIHKKNGGRSTARNAGLDAAIGEIISFVDSDDSILPKMLKTMVESLLKYDAQIAICGVAHITDSVESYREYYCEQINVLRSQEALEELLIDKKVKSYLCNKIFKRGLFQDLRFPVGRNYEDFSVLHYIFAKADRVLWLPDVLYEYRFRSDSVSGSFNAKAIHDSFIAYRERYDFAKDLPISDNTKDICLCNVAHSAISGLLRWYNCGENCSDYINDALSYVSEYKSLLFSSDNCAYIDKILIHLADKPSLFRILSRTLFLPITRILTNEMKEKGRLPRILELSSRSCNDR